MRKQKKIIRQKIQKTLKKMKLSIKSVCEKIIQLKRKNKVIIFISTIAVFVIPLIAPSFLDLMLEKIERFKPIVLFYEQELSQDVTYKIICSCYGVGDLPIVMHMSFTVKNQSQKSSENLTILYSYTDNVCPISDDRVIAQGFGIHPDDIKRSVSTNVNNKYVGSTISLPDINPNETFDVSDYVRVDNSDNAFTEMQVKISSKDMDSCYYNLDFYFIDIPDNPSRIISRNSSGMSNLDKP